MGQGLQKVWQDKNALPVGIDRTGEKEQERRIVKREDVFFED